MKSFVVFALIVAAAVAAPVNPDADAQVVEFLNEYLSPENYQYLLRTSNGINQEEQGAVQDIGTENEGIEVRGQYSYTGPDNVVYTVVYTAGRDGFRPQGAHLPKAN